MALATAEELNIMLGQTLDSAVASQVLADAARAVELDGISQSHIDFARLHRLYAAHLLEQSGVIGGLVASEGVGDVSRSYAVAASTDGLGQFHRQYRLARNQISGFKHRIR